MSRSDSRSFGAIISGLASIIGVFVFVTGWPDFKTAWANLSGRSGLNPQVTRKPYTYQIPHSTPDPALSAKPSPVALQPEPTLDQAWFIPTTGASPTQKKALAEQLDFKMVRVRGRITEVKKYSGISWYLALKTAATTPQDTLWLRWRTDNMPDWRSMKVGLQITAVGEAMFRDDGSITINGIKLEEFSE
jgi:hypothetical protein